jgi:hypothetical protein
MAERFSASQATKFMNCTASANLGLAIPNWVPPVDDPDADTAANRGTRMHAMFADVMSLSVKDAAMMAKAIEYVAQVRSTRRFKVLIEQPVVAEWLLTRPTTQADLVLVVADEIHIFDLKTGVIPVSPVENYQLMYYAVTYGPLAPKAAGAYLHIVQPWADVMEVWFADAARLFSFMTEAIRVEADIQTNVVTFSPGDHCLFCAANPHGRGARGRPNCPAMMELLYPQPPLDIDALLSLED